MPDLCQAVYREVPSKRFAGPSLDKTFESTSPLGFLKYARSTEAMCDLPCAEQALPFLVASCRSTDGVNQSVELRGADGASMQQSRCSAFLPPCLIR